ncbi:hypothetical protein DL89DRAFT_256888 [Linderina pennispora]|uniref:Uncharacterized protein n=1 Tax=Linderina pennispora TaxID=61395 RepID=A0A1Y1WAY8_9FUNG|nr:uncharacterized protein DL89DRAFT_256888 [Linderina pennispora]ORX70699.1 hypothetical protein DL89DRAFT_256888 [Linderina pennispora]
MIATSDTHGVLYSHWNRHTSLDASVAAADTQPMSTSRSRLGIYVIVHHSPTACACDWSLYFPSTYTHIFYTCEDGKLEQKSSSTSYTDATRDARYVRYLSFLNEELAYAYFQKTKHNKMSTRAVAKYVEVSQSSSSYKHIRRVLGLLGECLSNEKCRAIEAECLRVTRNNACCVEVQYEFNSPSESMSLHKHVAGSQ